LISSREMLLAGQRLTAAGKGKRSINLVDLFEKLVFFFLCLSIALLGIGRVEVPFFDFPFRSWSVSRTTFFFWLIWKALVWRRTKQTPLTLDPKAVSIPLFLFVGWVTTSVFPDFAKLGDYRYLLFAMGHYLMVLDVFDDDRRQSLLYLLLGVTPGILLVRGIYAAPAILDVNLATRFAYPLAHANPAGYLFSMSIPLCLATVLHGGIWLRPLATTSILSQLVALILTFSRMAWIATCAALLSISAGERKLRAIVFVLGVAGIAVFGGSSELRDRLWSLTAAKQDPDVVWRAEVMAHALSVGLDHPFIGNGYGRYYLRAALKKKFPEFAAQRYIPHSHDLYTELIAGVGFLGLAIFIWPLVSAAIQLLRKIARRDASSEGRYADLGLLGSLIAFVVAALGDVPFYNHETRIFFFTLLGLICLRLRPNTAAREASS
jgi:O-Antigen ligase